MFGQLEICLLESVGLPGHYNGTTLPFPNKQTNKSNPQRSYKMALILIVLLYFGAPQIISTTSWAKVHLEPYKEFIYFSLSCVYI